MMATAVPNDATKSYAAPPLDVSELLKTHAAAIVQLKESVKDVFPSAPDVGSMFTVTYDDIWLLRFVLSHPGDLQGAEQAVRSTLKWRKEKANLLMAARNNEPLPQASTFQRYSINQTHKCTRDGHALFIIRAGLSNPRALMNEAKFEDVVDWLLYMREQNALRCDKRTRESGKLVKVITVNDLAWASMGRTDGRFMQALKASAKLSEVYYPQWLHTGVLINLPPVLKVMARTVLSFMPKKTRERSKVCPGSTRHGDIRTCPFVRALFGEDYGSIPTFLGGACSCPEHGGCVAGVPNEQHSCNLEEDEHGMAQAAVPARGTHEVFMPIMAPGTTVTYEYSVEKGYLSGNGSLAFSMLLLPHSSAAAVSGGAGGQQPAAEAAAAEAPRHAAAAAEALTICQTIKIRPSDGPQKGAVTLPQPGLLVAAWHNSSLLVSRSLRFSVHITGVAPEHEAPEASEAATAAAAAAPPTEAAAAAAAPPTEAAAAAAATSGDAAN